jgi:hypothetical protein
MAKLNQDITFREIYLSVRERSNLDFTADRADIGFQNIEREIPSINYNLPFPLPELQNLEVIIDMLLKESIGTVHMEPYQKLRLLVKVFNGQIFYHRIGTGDTWRVLILF